jgi:predicted phosphoribosyltransferase
MLGTRLLSLARRDDTIVLGLPRGGVPVAFEIAEALGAPLDVFVVRKLGVPGREELALGAIASGGVRVVNRRVVEQLSIPPDLVEAIAAGEGAELARRERDYRGGRPPRDLTERTVILVDDGLATGASMRAAVAAIRGKNAAQVVVAVPVAAPESCDAVAESADDTICALTPPLFMAVGEWYEEFAPTTDDEVKELLARPRG